MKAHGLGSYCMASQAIRFYPFRFLSMGHLKELVYQTKVQNVDGLHRRVTAACEAVTAADAATHLAAGGLSSGRLSGHEGSKWELSASFSEVPMFLSVSV